MAESAPEKFETVESSGITFTHGDIAAVIEDFYTRIQFDPILAVPFRSVHDWPEHIHRLTHFWWVLLGGKPYLFNHYSPVAKHFFAGFNVELLARWLGLFHQTLQAHLSEPQHQLWKSLSERMGQSLLIKNEMFKEHYKNSRRQPDDSED